PEGGGPVKIGRSRLLVVAGVLGLGLAALGLSATRLQARVQRTSTVPTARVRRGDLSSRVHITGELRSARSTMLMGPAVGGALQIVALKPTGTVVKAQDVIVEVDPSEQELNLEHARCDLRPVPEAIKKTKVEPDVQSPQEHAARRQAR